MTYTETIQYLFNQMPMFERNGASDYKEGLANTHTLDEHFGHPHQNFATIHIAGTNGKGSCSHMIAAVLQECGYRVGLYTSPHLVDFRERIRINGTPISEAYVVDFVDNERKFFEPLHPSFFEVTTAMAFKYFSDMKVDIAVIEVGLGGRLDCTNVITPLISVITNISLDHTQLLGNTLAEIAGEKGGIIKHGVPVIIGENNEETRPVFEAKAKEVGAPIFFAEDNQQITGIEKECEDGTVYSTVMLPSLKCELRGNYQKKNLNTVLCTLSKLADQGFLAPFICDGDNAEGANELREALLHVCSLTGLMGRWQLVKHSPTVICDTGHNVGGWTYLSEQIQNTKARQRHIVFGMVGDKDVEGVIKLLPKSAIYYFTKPSNKRAMDEHQLMDLASRYGITGNSYSTVKEAYTEAYRAATHDDFIFVGGSSYIVADFLKTCV
jgi:dihydrofolate synthase/folylpolyglutamate synthase